MNWILCEDPGSPLWCLRSLEKCKQTRSLRDSAITRRNASCSTDIPTSGSAVKKPRLTKEVKTVFCITDTFVPLVVSGLSSNSGSNSSSTLTLQDLSPTGPAQDRNDGQASGNWSGSHAKTQKQIKIGMAIEIRTTVCEIFLNGWSCSQII